MTNSSGTDTGTDGTSALQPEAESDAATPIGQSDGRSLRRKRNRDAVIQGLIELIQEGDLNPTVAKIADRAEVSHRSVFRYFDDLNDLARTAIETEFRSAWPLSVLPTVGEGTVEKRIDDLVAAQLRVLQRTHLLAIVARSRATELEEVKRGMLTIYELRLDQIKRQFAPELSQMDDVRAEAIAGAIVDSTGVDAYDTRRRMFERTPEEIGEMWRLTLRALLD